MQPHATDVEHEAHTELMPEKQLHPGLASMGHPQRHRQGICLVYPSQVVLAQTRERVSTQWARPLVIFATELKAFKWETEVP